jgi:hypothetical protein
LAEKLARVFPMAPVLLKPITYQAWRASIKVFSIYSCKHTIYLGLLGFTAILNTAVY